MKKNFILPLLFLYSLTTFVQAQELAHTHTKIAPRLYYNYDSHFMEKLIAENPFLRHRWNDYDITMFTVQYFDLCPPQNMTLYLSVNTGNMGSLDYSRVYFNDQRHQIFQDLNGQTLYPLQYRRCDLIFDTAAALSGALLNRLNR